MSNVKILAFGAFLFSFGVSQCFCPGKTALSTQSSKNKTPNPQNTTTYKIGKNTYEVEKLTISNPSKFQSNKNKQQNSPSQTTVLLK